MNKHELIITRTNKKTKEVETTTEYFLSIYNAERRKFEVMDRTEFDHPDIRTSVKIKKLKQRKVA